jgi:hypothetical protein
MKRETTAKIHLKLKLERETLRALETSDLGQILGGVTSACKSGVTCCHASCNGTC